MRPAYLDAAREPEYVSSPKSKIKRQKNPYPITIFDRATSNFFLTQLRRGIGRSFRRLSLLVLSQVGNILLGKRGQQLCSVLYLSALIWRRPPSSPPSCHNTTPPRLEIGESLFQIWVPHRIQTHLRRDLNHVVRSFVATSSPRISTFLGNVTHSLRIRMHACAPFH